jgi:23S rRNA (guanine745-N1)-methyltransferase
VLVFPPALARFLDVLRCPVCGARRLHPSRGALRCPDGHSFDVARQGYAALLTGRRAVRGDDAAMIAARDRFLAAGFYAPIRRALARLASDAVPGRRGTVVDVGCGTGYHLAGVLDRLPTARGLGLDASSRALRAAARAHDRAAAAAWDVQRPFPLADAVADVVLNAFAPRNPAEFRRVLRRDGRLIVVRPTHRHLDELRGRVPGMLTVDPVKEQRLHRSLDPLFDAIVTERMEYPMTLGGSQARDLVEMTPRSAAGELRGVPGRVTVSVLVTAYGPR